jgi:competence protein ComEA
MKISARLLLATILTIGATAAWCTPVNINTADAATIATSLNGIGSVKAQAIVDYRQKHGAFRTVDELAQVKGISQKLINRNRADLRVDRVAGSNGPGTAAPHPSAKAPAQPASHN